MEPSETRAKALRNSEGGGGGGGCSRIVRNEGLPKMGMLFLKQEGNSDLNPSTNYVTFIDITWGTDTPSKSTPKSLTPPPPPTPLVLKFLSPPPPSPSPQTF